MRRSNIVKSSWKCQVIKCKKIKIKYVMYVSSNMNNNHLKIQFLTKFVNSSLFIWNSGSQHLTERVFAIHFYFKMSFWADIGILFNSLMIWPFPRVEKITNAHNSSFYSTVHEVELTDLHQFCPCSRKHRRIWQSCRRHRHLVTKKEKDLRLKK